MTAIAQDRLDGEHWSWRRQHKKRPPLPQGPSGHRREPVAGYAYGVRPRGMELQGD